MTWSKDSLFERSSDLTLRLEHGGRVRLVCESEVHEGDQTTLAILEAFSKPVAMQDAVEGLRRLTPGFGAFTKLMDEILHLIGIGALVQLGQDRRVDIGRHPARFDSLPIHIRMLNDTRRTQAFQEAIKRTVRPTDVVLEIGAGSGILAAAAAKAGARHVYAIERTPFAALARQVFESNGLADTITVIHGSSLQAQLPERADVLVAEIIGNDPLEEDIRRTFGDAVSRHLAPDARLLPERLRLYALPLSAPDQSLNRCRVSVDAVSAWRRSYGLDLSPLVEASINQDHQLSSNTYALRDWPRLADPVLLLDLDLRSAQAQDLEIEHHFRAERGGILTGMLVYFEALLGPAGWFSIAPDVATESNHWSSPVWIPGRPIMLTKGQRCDFTYLVRNNRSSFRLVTE